MVYALHTKINDVCRFYISKYKYIKSEVDKNQNNQDHDKN